VDIYFLQGFGNLAGSKEIIEIGKSQFDILQGFF